ncbi:MAG: hypothetical protein ACRC46_08865 [Thermoguttaceae bacterium]
MRSSSPAGTVTLMPFLAVLLCTMGALIMLLLVVAKDVRDQQDAATLMPNVASDAARELSALKAATEETQWLADQYLAAQDVEREKLALQRATLAFLESQTQKRLEEAELLARSLDVIRAGETPSQSRETLEAVLAEQQSRLAAASKRLNELRTKSASANKSYAIVPTPTSRGTYRRPMFIECRDNTVILQPEGIVLTDVDFLMAGRPEGPLNTALRSLQQYFAESGDTEEPYPLVVIRPSGAAIFPAVRASLGGWITDYGYEMVDEDWNIQYPQPNPEVRQRLETQVASARQRLLAFLSQMREEETNASQSGGTYRVGRGGVVERIDSGGTKIASRATLPPIGLGRPQPQLKTDSSLPDGAPEEHYNVDSNSARRDVMLQHIEQNGDSNISPYVRAPRGFNINDPDSYAKAKREIAKQDREQAKRENEQQKDAIQKIGDVRIGQGQLQKTAGPQEFPEVPPEVLYGENSAGESARQMHSQQKVKDNWGIREATEEATPIVRSIRIVCEKTRLSLPQQAGLSRKRDIPLDITTPASTQTSIEAFVGEVWDFMETWGIAGANKYWRPVLNVTVAADAEDEFTIFCRHLERSGFVIKRQ